MRRSLMVFISLAALVSSTVAMSAVGSETFTGTAARTGTYKRPLLLLDGTRYELKASDKADASVAELLAKFSQGDTGSYDVVGTRAAVNGQDGILVDSIAPAAKPLPRTGAAAPDATAVQGAAPQATAKTTPAVKSAVVTVADRRYTVHDYDDLSTRRYRFAIPEGLKTVRGLLVVGCHAGGDSTNYFVDCEYYRQFLHLHDFAFVGCTSTVGSPFSALATKVVTANDRHRAIFQAFRECVEKVATASRHPELVNAPYATTGFSAGGGFANDLMTFDSERTIAVGIYGSRYNFGRITPPPSAALLAIPAICITGEQENWNEPDPQTGLGRIDEVFVPYRPKGAHYAWLDRQGIGHSYDENRQDLLAMPLLDAAVRARYPNDGDVTKGPVKLVDIDPATGWVADNTTWKSGLTKIVPAKEFKGDLGHSSWLQNEDLAFIYRAYSTWDKPLTITSPGNCWPTVPALDPGASVPIIVDAARFPDWKTMSFYDGARKLGQITQGSAARFTATSLTPGYHVFSVLAADGDGTVRTADPKVVIVRNLSTDIGAARQ